MREPLHDSGPTAALEAWLSLRPHSGIPLTDWWLGVAERLEAGASPDLPALVEALQHWTSSRPTELSSPCVQAEHTAWQAWGQANPADEHVLTLGHFLLDRARLDLTLVLLPRLASLMPGLSPDSTGGLLSPLWHVRHRHALPVLEGLLQQPQVATALAQVTAMHGSVWHVLWQRLVSRQEQADALSPHRPMEEQEAYLEQAVALVARAPGGLAALNPHALDAQGRTALEAAIAEGKHSCLVRVMLRHGLGTTLPGHEPALHQAIRAVRAGHVEALLDHGADPSVCNAEGQNAWTFLAQTAQHNDWPTHHPVHAARAAWAARELARDLAQAMGPTTTSSPRRLRL